MTNKEDKLCTSCRFTVIKDPSNIFSSPKIAFASFYMDQFENPIIEMIPDESVIPSREKKVRVPSFNVLLTCVNESEIKIVLDSRFKWKETLVTRNFVVVSPIVSSIASLDCLASALHVLLEVIKTLKDLKLTTTIKSGKLTEPINKLITFLITRAINEMEDDDKRRMTVSANFNKANKIKMNEYKNNINKLIQTSSTNNNINSNPNENE